jgi:hypothetical protein
MSRITNEIKKYHREWMIALFASGYPIFILGLLEPNWKAIFAGLLPILGALYFALKYKIA